MKQSITFTFYTNSKVQTIIHDSDIDTMLKSIYSTIITKITSSFLPILGILRKIIVTASVFSKKKIPKWRFKKYFQEKCWFIIDRKRTLNLRCSFTFMHSQTLHRDRKHIFYSSVQSFIIA